MLQLLHFYPLSNGFFLDDGDDYLDDYLDDMTEDVSAPYTPGYDSQGYDTFDGHPPNGVSRYLNPLSANLQSLGRRQILQNHQGENFNVNHNHPPTTTSYSTKALSKPRRSSSFDDPWNPVTDEDAQENPGSGTSLPYTAKIRQHYRVIFKFMTLFYYIILTFCLINA